MIYGGARVSTDGHQVDAHGQAIARGLGKDRDERRYCFFASSHGDGTPTRMACEKSGD
jgi:hypothetical protein